MNEGLRLIHVSQFAKVNVVIDSISIPPRELSTWADTSRIKLIHFRTITHCCFEKRNPDMSKSVIDTVT